MTQNDLLFEGFFLTLCWSRHLVKFNFSFTCLLQTGHTALQRAAAEGHLEIVKTLLENGISVDHQDEVVSDKNYEVFDATEPPL